MPAHVLSKSKSAGWSRSDQDDAVRITMMGSAKVGKSSIINRFLYYDFQDDYKGTVEEMHIGVYNSDGINLTLEILDTAGAYDFPVMRKLAIANSAAFILVYSVDDQESFDEVNRLRQLIIEEKGTENVPIVIVGNKADSNEKKISTEMAEAIACIDWNSGFVEASAKDNENIVEIYKKILRQLKLQFALSPAVERRRRSLETQQHHNKCKRNSKTSFLRGIFSAKKSSLF